LVLKLPTGSFPVFSVFFNLPIASITPLKQLYCISTITSTLLCEKKSVSKFSRALQDIIGCHKIVWNSGRQHERDDNND